MEINMEYRIIIKALKSLNIKFKNIQVFEETIETLDGKKQKGIHLNSVFFEETKEFKEELLRLENEQKVQEVQERLMSLCDSKQNEAEKLILGYKATPKQIERYKDKYERALLEEFKEGENRIIIQKYSEYIEELNVYVDLIELFRGKVGDLIKAGNITEAKKLVDEGNIW